MSRAAQVKSVAWVPVGVLDYEGWVREGRRVGIVARGSAWWVGDWLCYGELTWGDGYARAAKITGYDPKTLKNMKYVASRFERSLRRDDLSWSHHALLAALPSEEQAHWLTRAVEEKFSVDDLRTELRRALRDPSVAENSQRSDESLSCANATTQTDSTLCPKCGYRFEPTAETG